MQNWMDYPLTWGQFVDIVTGVEALATKGTYDGPQAEWAARLHAAMNHPAVAHPDISKVREAAAEITGEYSTEQLAAAHAKTAAEATPAQEPTVSEPAPADAEPVAESVTEPEPAVTEPAPTEDTPEPAITEEVTVVTEPVTEAEPKPRKAGGKKKNAPEPEELDVDKILEQSLAEVNSQAATDEERAKRKAEAYDELNYELLDRGVLIRSEAEYLDQERDAVHKTFSFFLWQVADNKMSAKEVVDTCLKHDEGLDENDPNRWLKPATTIALIHHELGKDGLFPHKETTVGTQKVNIHQILVRGIETGKFPSIAAAAAAAKERRWVGRKDHSSQNVDSDPFRGKAGADTGTKIG
jgi:hypothetical protein